MADITDDILDLDQKQKDLKTNKGRYVQGLKTPEITPIAGSNNTITKLRKPVDETEEIAFEPKSKDYSFRVDVWKKKEGEAELDGYVITAERDLGNGVIETIVRKSE